ncbi:MAG: hypothetical protein HY070_07355 [Chloroflexi bacterium]|nr:hypothetical protein [Chloroflexota bacterium]MBI3742338.1 hypothetical protein [Chloroflexota bacterium]
MKKLARFIFLLSSVGCATLAPNASPTLVATSPAPAINLPTEKYLFVQYARTVEGSGRLPALAVDFPGYQFDANTGTLTLAAFPAPLVRLGATQIGLFGLAINRVGAAGTGGSSTLTPIEQLPYATSVPLFKEFANNAEVYENIALMLKALSADGSLQIEIAGESATLKSGGAWTRVIEKDATNPRGAAKISVTHTLTNYGLLERAKILQANK